MRQHDRSSCKCISLLLDAVECTRDGLGPEFKVTVHLSTASQKYFSRETELKKFRISDFIQNISLLQRRGNFYPVQHIRKLARMDSRRYLDIIVFWETSQYISVDTLRINISETHVSQSSRQKFTPKPSSCIISLFNILPYTRCKRTNFTKFQPYGGSRGTILDMEHLAADVSFMPKSASVLLHFGITSSRNYETPVETEDELLAWIMAACKRHITHLWDCVLEPVASLQCQNQQYTQRTANKRLWKRKVNIFIMPHVRNERSRVA